MCLYHQASDSRVSNDMRISMRTRGQGASEIATFLLLSPEMMENQPSTGEFHARCVKFPRVGFASHWKKWVFSHGTDDANSLFK